MGRHSLYALLPCILRSQSVARRLLVRAAPMGRQYEPHIVPFTDARYDLTLPYGQDYVAYFGREPLPRLTLYVATQGSADPVKYAGFREVILGSARNRFRGSQYRNGAWVDADIQRWPPCSLACGSGPRNMLAGLSWAYAVAGEEPSRRAMIASVYDVSVRQYKYPYG